MADATTTTTLGTTETLIPILPCRDPEATLGFFRMLGFEVTYQMTRPYLYLAVRRGGIDLHFGGEGGQGANEEVGAGACLVMVDRVEPYHQAFTEAMRAAYGRVLAKGEPRITRYRPGQTRFSLIDPTGNTVIFVERDEPDIDYGSKGLEGLARVMENARIFRESKLDDPAAAKVLDKGIARYWAEASALDRVRALAARAEIAVALEDPETVRAIQGRIAEVPLTAEERAAVAVELEAAGRLQEWLAAGHVASAD